MEVLLNKISGYASAITSIYTSKRHLTKEKVNDIYLMEKLNTSTRGAVVTDLETSETFCKEIEKVCKIGKKHITLLRFIDLEFTVLGIHRGAQDDFDAHAKRLDNRIIRASTRLADFQDEKSDWYKDKILTDREVLDIQGVSLPPAIVQDGITYVKTANGFIREDLANKKDVARGLCRLSIPSDFTAKVNITEFAHIVKLRDKNSGVAPELTEMIESLLKQVEDFCPYFTREFFYEIDN